MPVKKPRKLKKAKRRKVGKAKRAPAKKRPVGRPRRVVSATAKKLLAALAKSGATVTEMCTALKCNRTFFYRMLGEDANLRTAIKKAKEPADDRVERSLYERACGYEYTETMDEVGPKGRTTRVTNKHMAPDVAAAFIWLKNRRPEHWRDRREVAVSGLSLPEALDLTDEK